jgi:hypothetical protein
MVLATARDKTRLVKSTDRRSNCCWDSTGSYIGEEHPQMRISREHIGYKLFAMWTFVYVLLNMSDLPQEWWKERGEVLAQMSFHVAQEKFHLCCHLPFLWNCWIEESAQLIHNEWNCWIYESAQLIHNECWMELLDLRICTTYTWWIERTTTQSKSWKSCNEIEL